MLVEASKMNGPKDKYDRTIDLIDVKSGNLSPNVTGRVGDGDYDWMPDGASFVFVRTLDKAKPQLFRYTLATKAIVQLTHFKQGVSSPVVSHDGKRIALTVTDKDAVDDAYIDFSKAGFTPTDAQKKTDIHKITHALLRGQRPRLRVPRSSAHLDDRGRRLQRGPSDVREVGRRLRRLVARRSHDRVQFHALREYR